jgi:hypothetical protein
MGAALLELEVDLAAAMNENNNINIVKQHVTAPGLLTVPAGHSLQSPA